MNLLVCMYSNKCEFACILIFVSVYIHIEMDGWMDGQINVFYTSVCVCMCVHARC